MVSFLFDVRNRQFMRLWWAQLISQFGDRINQMALVGLIAERAPGSVMGLAKLLSFTIIPVFIVGPVAGAFIDRWDRRRTLFFCDILRGLIVLTIPFIFIYRESMVPIYIVVFLVFCCSRFYIPAKMSIIPDLVTQENLLMANSLITTTGMIAFVLGVALGGLIVETFGARGGFIADAVTFFVSGLLIISIAHDFRLRINGAQFLERSREIIKLEKSIIAEMKEGWHYLVNQADILFVMNMFFVLLAAAGAVYVVIIVFIQQQFHSITGDLSILAVCLGVGLFLGALGYGRWGKKFPWYKTIFTCLIGGGVMMIFFALAVKQCTNIFSAAVLSVTLGLVVGPIFIASNTIVHLVSDEHMRGKVFSAMEIVMHFAFLVAMLVSAFLSEYIARVWILVGVGGVFALVGLIGLIKYKNGRGLAVEGKDGL